MSDRSTRGEASRFALMARRRRGTSQEIELDDQHKREVEIMDYLTTGGPPLPEPLRAAEMRAELLSRAAELGSLERIGPSGAPTAVTLRPRGWIPVLARAAVAVLIAFMMFAGIGAASTYAMPGDPVYSIKRLIERAHLFVLPGGQARANAYLRYADERMDELEYAGARGMNKWYEALAADAQNRIDGAYGVADTMKGSPQAGARERAFRAEERLEALIRRALPFVSGDIKTAFERVMNRARRHIQTPGEGKPGVPVQEGQQPPGGPGDQQDSTQYEEQQGQQQQGQPPIQQSQPQPDSGQQKQNTGQQSGPGNGATWRR